MSRHFFDNAAPQRAGRGFASLEPPYDLATIRYLEATGIGTGWRYLAVGGGSPASSAAAGPDRIGPSPSASPIADRPRPGSGAAAFASRRLSR